MSKFIQFFLIFFTFSNLAYSSWADLDGTYKASDTTFCKGFLDLKFQKAEGWPEIFHVKSGDEISRLEKRFSFAIGEWGVGNEYSYSYETENSYQGHYYTLLRFDSNKTLKYELKIKVVSKTGGIVGSIEFLYQDYLRNESEYCFYLKP